MLGGLLPGCLQMSVILRELGLCRTVPYAKALGRHCLSVLPVVCTLHERPLAERGLSGAIHGIAKVINLRMIIQW